MSSFFSIIIPVYNVAPYLRECIDSVLDQTFSDWEAICVDDGSTDDGGVILDNYMAKDDRIKVIHQKNAGVSVARNAALEIAKGEYVCFLDADDLWQRWALKYVADIVDDTKTDWVRIDSCDWCEESACPICERPSKNVVQMENQDVSTIGWKLISRCGLPFVNFYKRSMLGDVVFAAGIRFREDALFAFEAAAHMHSICVTDAKCYIRRLRANGAMSSPQRRDDSIKVLTAYREMCDRLAMKYGLGFFTQGIIAASTFWVAKDVRRWLLNCPGRTQTDEKYVYSIVSTLRRRGVVSFSLADSPRVVIGWWGYLLTGKSWFLSASRHNITGRAPYKRFVAN